MEIYDPKNHCYLHEKDKKILKFLYHTLAGRVILKLLTKPCISYLVGKFLSSKMSLFMVNYYIKKYKIDITHFEPKAYKSFNDFFTRKKKGKFLSSGKNNLIVPADSVMLYYKVTNELTLSIKNSVYSLPELLQDKDLANEYKGGTCLVYRLSPNDYHRYIYIAQGREKEHKKIKGMLHTVHPIGLESQKVFVKNTREITILEMEKLGKVVQIEVGALLVGKIRNYHKLQFLQYEEKGYFEFGGSTIIQLILPNKVQLEECIIQNSKKEIETKVGIGEEVGIILS